MLCHVVTLYSARPLMVLLWQLIVAALKVQASTFSGVGSLG